MELSVYRLRKWKMVGCLFAIFLFSLVMQIVFCKIRQHPPGYYSNEVFFCEDLVIERTVWITASTDLDKIGADLCSALTNGAEPK